MGVNVDMRYFGTGCRQSERRGAGLARCVLSVRLRRLLGTTRGQTCKPARVPRASLPGEAAPAFLGRGPGEEQGKEGASHECVSGSACESVSSVSASDP